MKPTVRVLTGKRLAAVAVTLCLASALSQKPAQAEPASAGNTAASTGATQASSVVFPSSVTTAGVSKSDDSSESDEQKRMHASVSVEVRHEGDSRAGGAGPGKNDSGKGSSETSTASQGAGSSTGDKSSTSDSTAPQSNSQKSADSNARGDAKTAQNPQGDAFFTSVPGVVRKEDSDLGKKLTLPITSWKSPDMPTKGVILALHGATLYGDTYNLVANHFAKEGYPVYALDMRGYGRWRFQNELYHSDSGIHYTQTREDIIKALQELKQEYPGKPIFCMGESLGANMAIWTAADRPDLLDGAIMSSPCVKQAIHPRPRWIIDFIRGLRHPYDQLSLKPYVSPYLSEDKRVTTAYLADPMINRYLSAADLIKSMRTNQWSIRDAHKIPASLPMLVVAGKKDRIYRADALPDLVEALGSKNVEVHIEPQKGHLLLETKYFDQPTVNQIDSWLGATAAHKDKISESQHAITTP